MGFTGAKALKFKIAFIDAFNKMEEQLQSSYQQKLPTTKELAQMLLDECNKNEALQLQMQQQEAVIATQQSDIKSLKPHAQYAIEVLEAKTEWTATNAAKTLGLKSPQQLNFILKEMKVHRKVEGVWVLNAKYEGKGYTKVRTSAYSDSNGEVQTSKATVWTESGIRFAKEDRIQY